MTRPIALRAIRHAATALSVAALLMSGNGCQSADERPPIGGETHFLRCNSDAVCRTLSPDHVCIDQICRLPPPRFDAAPPPVTAVPDAAPEVPDAAPAPAVPDAAARDAGPRAPTVDAAETCARGQVAASEVVVLGDSFFGSSHEITAELEQLATAADSLNEGERFRDYSRLLGNALAFMGEGIAEQYAEALADGAISVVIMNGGGADALLGTCATPDATCPLVTAAAAAAERLFEAMAADGVGDVVYAFYPDALDEPTRARVDALRPLIRDACAAAPLDCHWLDLRPVFDGRYDEFIAPDGLNPTSLGAEATAAAIWALMQTNCIAQ